MKYILDVDASKVIEAVRSTGVTITPAMMHYAHYLISNMKNIGTWQLSNAVYGFVGGTAASHKWNWKDLRDVDAAFRLTFFNSPTHNSSGVLWNGTNQYANTFLIPSTTLSTTSTHLSYYTPTNNLIGSQTPIGTIDIDNTKFLQINITLGSFLSGGVTSITSYPPTTTNGYTIGIRQAINLQAVFYKGLKVAANTFSGNLSLPANSVFIGGRNSAVGLNQPSVHTASFSSIGAGFTDTQAQQQSQIVTNAQAILNRA